MTRPAADRVKVEWSGTGTGTMTLGAAVTGFQAFPSTLNSQVVSYSIEHQTSSEAESGYGTYTSSGTTLTRTYRTYPTLGGSAVNFSSGTKHVRITAIAADIAANLTTSDPGVSDDIASGYRRGNLWINTATPSIWACLNPTAGAAVWARLDAAPHTHLIADITDAGQLASQDEADLPAATANFRAAGNETLLAAFQAVVAGGDATPTQVTATASPFALTTAMRLSANVEVLSNLAGGIDFEVPTTAPAGSKWYIRSKNDLCSISVNTDVGSVNGTAGGSVKCINGGVAIIEIDSNAGTAPVVLVRGDIIVPPIVVGGSKTYDNEDANQDYRLTSTNTQIFGASSGYQEGYTVTLFRETTGTITIDGADADYTITGPDVVSVFKIGTALIAAGKAGVVILDAA